MASKGTINKSSKSKIDTIFCPRLVESALRSPNTCITMAVEVSTKPAEETNATSQETPNCTPTIVIKIAEITTCMLPSPKIWRRKLHR